ncbi:MAG: TonB-dependent receptor [Bacteroidetes bacterium]|nr:TonB-dependent receptor [Bacteroidota bacterium]
MFLIVIGSMTAFVTYAQDNGRISGTVLDKRTQKAISGAAVSIKGSTKAALTDTNGLFRITGIPVKTYTIEIRATGYQLLSLYNIILSAGNEYTVNIELEPQVTELAAVVVSNNRRTAKAATLESPLSVQRLTLEEIRSNPGGNFDISKAIQALPGVGGGAEGGSFRNDIIIRGGAPNENVYYLDGIEIPVLNHFQTQGSSGGPQGMLNISFIEDVKLSSSAFDARYDNALSSVFQFKQRNGNANKFQGNARISATDVSATLEGPLSKDRKTSFLASARRSYLQLLFSAIDLPIRPNYWDFQTKITRQIDPKTTLSFMALGAIDQFSLAPVKKATPEKLYIINANPSINQWNYTFGLSLKKLIRNGYVNWALSRNAFDNAIESFEDNTLKLPSQRTLDYTSRETENKLRVDVNKNIEGWKISYGASLQYVQYQNRSFSVIRKELKDSVGNLIQPAITVNFNSPLSGFWRYGAFVQAGKRFLDNRLGISGGLRTDMNSFTSEGNQPLQTLSPRISFSYVLADKWTANISAGRYYKLPPYTILGFADNNGLLVNRNSRYQRSDHYVAGIEYLPNDGLRFTAEAFYKLYDNVPVSVRNGISLANLGGNFDVLGNEAVITNGKGKAWGVELFAQKKLTERFFGIFSYTFYRSQYSGNNGNYLPSSWDNKHLLSLTWGYKFKRNWELGMKFRYQGGAPYTPYDMNASRLNYLSLGRGVFDYAQLNSMRLRGFHSADIRIDKKWNFRKTTIDLFLDITNFLRARNQPLPNFTFTRNANNTAFITTDGRALKADGSNAIPILLQDDSANFIPSIGLIVEF